MNQMQKPPEWFECAACTQLGTSEVKASNRVAGCLQSVSFTEAFHGKAPVTQKACKVDTLPMSTTAVSEV